MKNNNSFDYFFLEFLNSLIFTPTWEKYFCPTKLNKPSREFHRSSVVTVLEMLRKIVVFGSNQSIIKQRLGGGNARSDENRRCPKESRKKNSCVGLPSAPLPSRSLGSLSLSAMVFRPPPPLIPGVCCGGPMVAPRPEPFLTTRAGMGPEPGGFGGGRGGRAPASAVDEHSIRSPT